MCSLGCGRNLPESSSFPETASPKGAGEGEALEKDIVEPTWRTIYSAQDSGVVKTGDTSED